MTIRLAIATPIDAADPDAGTVSYGYHRAVRELERAGAVLMAGDLMFADDVVKARSRVAHAVLKADITHCLWWDADVVPTTAMVRAMLETGHEVIGAPYRRKRKDILYPYVPLDINNSKIPVVNNCAHVRYLSFGFMLTSRFSLQSMTHHYAWNWWSDVRPNGDINNTVKIFDLVNVPPVMVGNREHRDTLSEDWSFCYRWNEMGGAVQMFVGDGSPVKHVGSHVFVGSRETLGQWR